MIRPPGPDRVKKSILVKSSTIIQILYFTFKELLSTLNHSPNKNFVKKKSLKID